MKNIGPILLTIFMIASLLAFQNCSDSSDEPSDKEVAEEILQSKSWSAASVNVPSNTATESDDWINFGVSFMETNMNTSGHPAGAEAVWPSGTYTVSEDGNSITRGDGIIMSLSNVSENGFSASFSVPDGTHIGGRIAALDGPYVFNME
jgi:hypothetical protein